MPKKKPALLVDTHIWLWWRADDPKLGPAARKAIRNAREVRFSAASAWEIAIKQALGKVRLPRDIGDIDLSAELALDGFVPLAISIDHALAVALLPPIHRDPFDRMLVAQASIEGLTLVTADPEFSAYDVPLLAGRN